MTIGLIAWGRFVDGAGRRVTVPAPVDPVPDGQTPAPWLYDFVRERAAELGAYFDMVQWPPSAKAQGGAAPTADGYGVFDPRDLGTKNQQGSVPTRYGTLESLMAAVAALNAHGCASYGDLVMHQRSGENGGPGIFEYLGADGTPRCGRGGTQASWFRGETKWDPVRKTWADPVPPFRPADPVPVPADDFPFGRELVYHNCYPEGASLRDAMDYVRWLTGRTGFAGYRFDDTKGTNPAAVRAIMDAVPRVPFYSEYFDGNPENLNWWATSPPMSERSAVEDFTLHWRLQAACNGFDARLFAQGGWGYGQWRPDLSVGPLENPDTDTSRAPDGGISQQVVFNKCAGYALLLNLPLRLALVYGKDYFPSSVWPGAYGLHAKLDPICWFARTFAIGGFAERWVDPDVYAYTRDGNGGPMGWSGGCLVAVNFNTSAARTVTVETMWREGTWIHDYAGHCPDATVGAGGWVTVHLPSNAHAAGLAYGLWAPGGVNHAVPVTPRATTQVYDAGVDQLGRGDLDVLPVRNGMQTLPQRIRCAKGEVRLQFVFFRTRVAPDATVQVELVNAAGERMAWATTGDGPTATLSVLLAVPGWHSIRLTGNLLPVAGMPFTLAATYVGVA